MNQAANTSCQESINSIAFINKNSRFLMRIESKSSNGSNLLSWK